MSASSSSRCNLRRSQCDLVAEAVAGGPESGVNYSRGTMPKQPNIKFGYLCMSLLALQFGMQPVIQQNLLNPESEKTAFIIVGEVVKAAIAFTFLLMGPEGVGVLVRIRCTPQNHSNGFERLTSTSHFTCAAWITKVHFLAPGIYRFAVC